MGGFKRWYYANYRLGLSCQLLLGLTWMSLFLGGGLKNNLGKSWPNFEIVTEILGLFSLNFKQTLCKIYKKFQSVNFIEILKKIEKIIDKF